MTILAATDFSQTGNRALRVAAAEAKRSGSALSLLHVIDTFSERWEYIDREVDDIESKLQEAATERLEEAFDDAVRRRDQPEIEEMLIREGSAPETMVEVADAGDYELLVLGATGGGALARVLLGSTAEEVVRASETPVLVVPRDTDLKSVDRVLAPVDLSECSRHSLSMAANRARIYDAELLILHVSSLPSGALTLLEWEPSEDALQEHEKFQSRQMQEFLEEVDLEGLETESLLRFAAPDREILDVARDREVDLLVLGTHGRRGMERFFLGSTASKVLRHLPCPAITVRYTGGEEIS